MAFMDWAVEVAAAHPELKGAFINADGEWLDILLADGRTFRFRPAQLMDASKPEAVRRELLTRLISIGVSRAEAAPGSDGPESGANGPGPGARESSPGTKGPDPLMDGSDAESPADPDRPGADRFAGAPDADGSNPDALPRANAAARGSGDSEPTQGTGEAPGAWTSASHGDRSHGRPSGPPSGGGEDRAAAGEAGPSAPGASPDDPSAANRADTSHRGPSRQAGPPTPVESDPPTPTGPSGPGPSAPGTSSPTDPFDDVGSLVDGLDLPFEELDSSDEAETASGEHLMPIVRSADYFVRSHDHARDDSMVYVPMTPFIGTGIAVDSAHTITPLFFSDLENTGLPSDIVPLFQHALTRLRTFDTVDGQPSVQVYPQQIGGANVFDFTGPANYQSSWFTDVEMALTVSESLSKANRDSLPLFVPASRASLFVVMADDPHLPELFTRLAKDLNRPDTIYPLPHVVTQDGWSEWIPMPDHPAAKALAKIRTSVRERIYRAQAEAMRTWPGDFGRLVEFQVLRQGSLIASPPMSSLAIWTSDAGYGSLPDTDFVAFLRQTSAGEPWEERDWRGMVVLRAQVARDVWHEGISPMTNVWPPRWSVRGFPDDAQLNALREASDREF